jgi:hypothetical protein
LKSLLQTANFSHLEVELIPILSSAANWLETHEKHPERGFVIARLLRMRGLSRDLWELLAYGGLDFLDNNREGLADDYLLNSIVARLRTLSASDQTRWAKLAARWIGCTEKAKDVISLFNNCRKFLPKEHLSQICPILESANQRRPDLPLYDWERPFPSEYRETL